VNRKEEEPQSMNPSPSPLSLIHLEVSTFGSQAQKASPLIKGDFHIPERFLLGARVVVLKLA